MRPIRTAYEAMQASDATNALNYKKSFDMLLDYLLKEISNACRRGEYSIRVKLLSLEKYICNDKFDEILDEVERVLSYGVIVRSSSPQLLGAAPQQMCSGLGYTVEREGLFLVIKWEEPMQSPLDIGLEQNQNMPK